MGPAHRSQYPAFTALARIVDRPTADSVEGLDPLGLAAVAELAIEHRVAASLAAALADARRPVPPDVAGACARAAVGHLQTLRTLEAVSAAFESAAIPWAVVKGPVIAARWGGGGATARAYADLDLLVAPGDLRAAVGALQAAGYRHRNRNWSGFRRLGVAELPLDDGNVVIDLHWNLLALADQRRSLGLDTAALLRRVVPIDLGRISVPTLDDADTLVHLCCHHALAGARRLVELRDVHLLGSVVPPATARERLRTAGASRLAGPVMDRAERVFGPMGDRPVAEAVCGHRVWIRVNRVVDRAWSALRPLAWTPFPGAVVGAGRGTTADTLRATWSLVADSVRVRLGLSTLVSAGGPLDWDHASGDPVTEYQRYLAWVEGPRMEGMR